MKGVQNVESLKCDHLKSPLYMQHRETTVNYKCTVYKVLIGLLKESGNFSNLQAGTCSYGTMWMASLVVIICYAKAGGRFILNSPSSCIPVCSRPDSDGDASTKNPTAPEAGTKATARTGDWIQHPHHWSFSPIKTALSQHGDTYTKQRASFFNFLLVQPHSQASVATAHSDFSHTQSCAIQGNAKGTKF